MQLEVSIYITADETNGFLYVSGTFTNDLTFYDTTDNVVYTLSFIDTPNSFIAQYDFNGVLNWVRRLNYSTTTSLTTNTVNNNMLMASNFTNSPFLSGLNFDGIAMSADGTIRTVVVSGGKIYVSTDSGFTWDPKDSDRDWKEIAMSADGSVQTAGVFGGNLYVSTDTGNTWVAKDSARNWRGGISMSADGVIQNATVLGGQIYVSINTGDTWTARGPSLGWFGIDMSADGSIQTAIPNGDQIYVSYQTGD